MAGNQVRIGVGTTGARQASSELDQLRDKFTNLQKQGAKGFAIGVGAAATTAGIGLVSSALDGLGGAVADSIQKASDLNESMSKTSVVFGDSAGEIIKWASTAAKSMGLSKQAALEASGTLGNLLLSMGKAPAKAADMSKTMVQLAADLASFNNVDIEEVLMAMRSGLTGEIAPLRRFGVNLTDATLKAKAMELGLSDGKEALDVSAKSSAAYALILEQTTTAQGDFARTATGMANQQRILQAELDDTSARFGAHLIPLVIEAQARFIGLADSIDKAGGSMGELEKHKSLDDILFKGTPLSAKGIEDFLDFITPWDGTMHEAAQTFGDLADSTAADVEAMRGNITAGLAPIPPAIDKVSGSMNGMRDRTEAMAFSVHTSVDKASGSMNALRERAEASLHKVGHAAKVTADDYETAMRRVRASSQKTADKLRDDAQDDIDNAFDPQINHYKLVAAEAETSAARRAAAAKGAGDAEKEAVLEAEKAEAEFLLAAARAGDTNSQAYKKGVAGLKEEIKNATGPTKDYLQGILDKLNAIDSIDPTVTIRVNAAISQQAKAFGVTGGVIQDFGRLSEPEAPTLSAHQLHVQHLANLAKRASGGPVKAGVPYLVGERGPEVEVPKTDATIIPHGGTAMTGSFTLNVHVHPAPGMTPAAGRQFGEAAGPPIVAWMQRNGILPRGASPLHG